MTGATLHLTRAELIRLYWHLTHYNGTPVDLYRHLWGRIARMLDESATNPMRDRLTYDLRMQTRQAAASWRAWLDTFHAA